MGLYDFDPGTGHTFTLECASGIESCSGDISAMNKSMNAYCVGLDRMFKADAYCASWKTKQPEAHNTTLKRACLRNDYKDPLCAPWKRDDPGTAKTIDDRKNDILTAIRTYFADSLVLQSMGNQVRYSFKQLAKKAELDMDADIDRVIDEELVKAKVDEDAMLAAETAATTAAISVVPTVIKQVDPQPDPNDKFAVFKYKIDKAIPDTGNPKIDKNKHIIVIVFVLFLLIILMGKKDDKQLQMMQMMQMMQSQQAFKPSY